jgi:hypothetical protein
MKSTPPYPAILRSLRDSPPCARYAVRDQFTEQFPSIVHI